MVQLGAVHHIGDGFRRGPESDRQHAGGERIEGAAMAAFLRVEPAFQAVDDIGAGQALRFVDDEPAVQRTAALFALAHTALVREMGGA